MFENRVFLKITAFITCLSFFTYFIFIFPGNKNIVLASGKVVSLPADLDCSVTYDSSYISLELNGKEYSISRQSSLVHESGYQFVYCAKDGYVYAVKGEFNISRKNSYGNSWKNITYLPITFEKYSSGYCDTSYWLDPINLKVYVFSTAKNDSWGQFPGVLRYFDGKMLFSITYNKAHPWVVTTSIIDLASGTVDVGLSYAYYVRSDYFTDVTTNYSLNSYYAIDTGDLADYATYYPTEYQASDCNPCYYGAYPFISCGVTTELPDNLVCIFANHAINGYFESNGDVITPDYYFQYQYVFFKEDRFFFIDSTSEISSIDLSGKPTFYFKEESNFYFYISNTGEQWSPIVTVDTMHGSSFVYGVSFSDTEPFKLIYTNDTNYGNSIKDWESFPDFLNDINTNDSLKDYIQQIVNTENPIPDSEDKSVGMTIFDTLWAGLNGVGAALSLNFGDAYSIISDSMNSLNDNPDEVIFSLLNLINISNNNIENALTAPDYFHYLEYDPTTDTWNSIRQTSIYKLLTMNLDYMEDLSLIGKTIRQENFNWMKTLNGNFSSLYDLTVLQGDNLNDSLDSIVSAINNIDVSSSGGSFDLSGITGRFDSLLDGISSELQDYDYNPNDNDNSVVDYVSDGLDEIITGNILQPLTFSSGVVAAIGFVNDAITNIWENLGDLQPVVVLGLTFTVVDVVVRREGSEA